MEEDKVSDLEEGELSSDFDNNYTPLERPSNYSASFNRLPNNFPDNQPSESDIEPESTDSDSDSDTKQKKCKKPKIKLKPRARYANKNERKKYDIWSTRVQDEILAETLNSCDVTTKDRSRNVETYDTTNAYRYGGKNREWRERKNNKRTRDDMRNVNFRLSRKNNKDAKDEGESVKSTKRVILDLNVNENCSAEDLAKDIANKLYEEKEDLILNVINILGKKKAIEIFEETKSIEFKGGLLIMNQTRRRTPGGVYLYLVRQDYTVTQDQKREIFHDERQKNKQQDKNKRREKSKKIKQEIAAAQTKFLPDLLTRAELLASQNMPRKVIKDQSDESDVINPPPTPETDGHCDENSGDGMDSHNAIVEVQRPQPVSYGDDFLDIGSSADMDLF